MSQDFWLGAFGAAACFLCFTYVGFSWGGVAGVVLYLCLMRLMKSDSKRS